MVPDQADVIPFLQRVAQILGVQFIPPAYYNDSRPGRGVAQAYRYDGIPPAFQKATQNHQTSHAVQLTNYVTD